MPPSIWPARLDPTISFANYSTYHLHPATLLTLTEPSAADALSKLSQYRHLDMVNYASFIIPTEDELKQVFERAEASLPNGCSAQDLVCDIEPRRRPYVLRSLAWLCKLGLLQF